MGTDPAAGDGAPPPGAARTQLSPGGAVVLGLIFGVAGVLVILLAVGVLGSPGALTDTPRWVGVAAGLLFMLFGATIVLGFAVAGGATPTGDLPAGTPLGVRLTQYLLGLGIVSLMAAIFGWVALGSGSRHFRVTGIPFLGTEASEATGRVVFGIGAALIVVFGVVLAVVNVRRLRASATPSLPGAARRPVDRG